MTSTSPLSEELSQKEASPLIEPDTLTPDLDNKAITEATELAASTSNVNALPPDLNATDTPTTQPSSLIIDADISEQLADPIEQQVPEISSLLTDSSKEDVATDAQSLTVVRTEQVSHHIENKNSDLINLLAETSQEDIVTNAQSSSDDVFRSEQLSDPIKSKLLGDSCKEVGTTIAQLSTDYVVRSDVPELSNILAELSKDNEPNAEQDEASKKDAVQHMDDDDGNDSDASDYDRLVIDAPEREREPSREVDALSRLESVLLVAAAAAELQHTTHTHTTTSTLASEEPCNTDGVPAETATQEISAENVALRADSIKPRAQLVESRSDIDEIRAESVGTAQDDVASVESSADQGSSQSQSDELRAEHDELRAGHGEIRAENVQTVETILCLDSDESSSKSVEAPPPPKKKKKKYYKTKPPADILKDADGDDESMLALETNLGVTARESHRVIRRALNQLASYKDYDWNDMLRGISSNHESLSQARLLFAQTLRYLPAIHRPQHKSCYSKLRRYQAYAALAKTLSLEKPRTHRLVQTFKQCYYQANNRTTFGALVEWSGWQPHELVYRERLVEWLDEHLPAWWRCWELNNLTYRQMFPETPSHYYLCSLRFLLPTKELARVFLHSPHEPMRTYRDNHLVAAKRLLLSWPLGRALIVYPATVVSRVHGAASEFARHGAARDPDDTARHHTYGAVTLHDQHFDYRPAHIDSAYNKTVPLELPQPTVYTEEYPEELPLSLREMGHEWIRVTDEYLPKESDCITGQRASSKQPEKQMKIPAESVNEFLLQVGMAARGGMKRGALEQLKQRWGRQVDIVSVWQSWSGVVSEAARVWWVRGDECGALRAADWLALDVLILDETLCPVLTQKYLSSYESVMALSLLTRLCIVYNVESDPDAFNAVHHVYLSQGRYSSVVLLQRRWWELKRLVASLPGVAANTEGTHPILHAIMKRFPHVLTSPLAEWSDLVREQKIMHNNVMYYEEEPLLRSRMPDKYKHIDASLDNPFTGLTDEEDDIMIVEKEIETIELDDECDSDSNSRNTTDVKREGDDDMEQDDLLFQDVKETGDIQTKVILDSDSDSVDNEPPRELDIDREINDLSNTIANEILGEELRTENDNTEPITDDIVFNQSNTEKTDNLRLSNEKDLKNELLKVLEINMSVDDNRQVGGVSVSEVSKSIDSDDSRPDFSADAGCSKNENNTLDGIDPKLVMIPIVNLTALHYIPAWSKYSRRRKISLKNLDVEDLYDKQYKNILKKRKLESDKRNEQNKSHGQHSSVHTIKQKLNPTPKKPTINVLNHLDKPNAQTLKLSKEILMELDIESQKQTKDIVTTEIESMPVIVNPSEPPKKVHLNVKKTRRYTSIGLSKNPDFHTELKNLSSQFWLSDRNRTLINECIPVTVDLIKLTLQKKLVENFTELPKGRILKKIELPDINDVRRINRNILTAAVNPINVRTVQKETRSDNREVVEETSAASSAESIATVTPQPLPQQSPEPSPTPAGGGSKRASPQELAELLQSLQAPLTRKKICCPARRWLVQTAARRRAYFKAHARRPPAPTAFVCPHNPESCSCCCLAEVEACRRWEGAGQHTLQLHQHIGNLLAGHLSELDLPKSSSCKPKEPPASTATPEDNTVNSKHKPCRIEELRKLRTKQRKLRRREQRKREKEKTRLEGERESPSEAADGGLEAWIREKNKARALFGVSPPKRKPPPPPKPPTPPPPAPAPTLGGKRPATLCLPHSVIDVKLDGQTEQIQTSTQQYIQVRPKQYVKILNNKTNLRTEQNHNPNVKTSSHKDTINIYERNIFDSSVARRQVDIGSGDTDADVSIECGDSDTDGDVNLVAEKGNVAVPVTPPRGNVIVVKAIRNGNLSVRTYSGVGQTSQAVPGAEIPKKGKVEQKFINIFDRDALQTVNNQIKVNAMKRKLSNPSSSKLADVTDSNVTDSNVTDSNYTDSNVTDSNVTDSNVTDSNVNVSESTALTKTSTTNYVFLNENGSKIPCEFLDANTALLRRGGKSIAININSLATRCEPGVSAEHAHFTIDLTDDVDDNTKQDVSKKKKQRVRLKRKRCPLDPAAVATTRRGRRPLNKCSVVATRYCDKPTVSVQHVMSKLAPRDIPWFKYQRNLLHAPPYFITVQQLLNDCDDVTNLKLLQTDKLVANYYYYRLPREWLVVTSSPRDSANAVFWRPAPRPAHLQYESCEGEDSSAPARVCVRDSLYCKLCDRPLVYAQVFSVLAGVLSVAEAMSRGQSLLLYHVSRGLMLPLHTGPGGELLLPPRLHDEVRLLELESCSTSLAVARLNELIRRIKPTHSTSDVYQNASTQVVMETSLKSIDNNTLARLTTSGVSNSAGIVNSGVKMTTGVSNSGVKIFTGGGNSNVKMTTGVSNSGVKIFTGGGNSNVKMTTGVSNSGVKLTTGVADRVVNPPTKVDSGVLNPSGVGSKEPMSIKQKLIFEEDSDSSDDETPLSLLRGDVATSTTLHTATAHAPVRTRRRTRVPPPAVCPPPPSVPLRRRILAGTLARSQKKVYTSRNSPPELSPGVRVIKLNPQEMKELLSYSTLDQSFTFRGISLLNNQNNPAEQPPAAEPSTSCDTGPSLTKAKIFKAKDIERWRKIIDSKIVALAKADASVRATETTTHRATPVLDRGDTSCVGTTFRATETATHGASPTLDRVGASFVDITLDNVGDCLESESVQSNIVIGNVMSLSSNNVNVENNDANDVHDIVDTQVEKLINQNDNDANDGNVENDTSGSKNENDTSESKNENDTSESKNENDASESKNENNLSKSKNENDASESKNENDASESKNENDASESKNGNDTNLSQNEIDKTDQDNNENSQSYENAVSYESEMEIESTVSSDCILGV